MSNSSNSVGVQWTALAAAGVIAGLLLAASPVAAEDRGALPPGDEREEHAAEQHVLRVSEIIDLSVRSHDGQLLGAVDDFLIADEGQFQALIVRAPEPGDDRWQVPWDEVEAAVDREEVLVEKDAQELDPFFGPVSGTLGTVDGTLVSKLLAAEVTDHLENALGRVVDLRVNVEGEVLAVLFWAPAGLADVVTGEAEPSARMLMAVPWTAVTVQRDMPVGYIADADPDARIVVTAEGVGEQEPAPAEEGVEGFVR